MPRSKVLSITIGLVVLVSALVLALGAGEGEVERNAPQRRVRVATAEPAASAPSLRFAGTLRATRRASLAFTLGGRLASRPVEVGDAVRAGQVLARLDGRELDNAVAAARAALAEVDANVAQRERDVAREEQLLATKAATAEDVEQAKSGLDALHALREAARARLREAERLLGETTLTAPFAGTVSEVHAEPGENAAPGVPVAVVSGAGALEVEVAVPESTVAAIAVGQAVEVELPFAAATVTGTVRSVGRAAMGSGKLFPVLVEVPEGPGCVAGATANVALRGPGTAALAVPLAAVLNPGGAQPTLFRLADGRAERIAVEVLGLVGERVAVAGALAAGDEVVVAGHGSLIDGDAVEVVR